MCDHILIINNENGMLLKRICMVMSGWNGGSPLVANVNAYRLHRRAPMVRPSQCLCASGNNI